MPHFILISHLSQLMIMENFLPEDFRKLVLRRQSDRGYLDTPVGRNSIERIIETARLAPSACNAQPWKFIVVDDPALRDRIAGTTTLPLSGMNKFVKEAPVLVVITMEAANITSALGSKIKRKHFPLMDIGIVAGHICLAATAEGLGSCMVGWFDEPQVKKLLSISDHSRPVLIITLGYAKSDHTRNKQRKPLDQILCYNNYLQKESLADSD